MDDKLTISYDALQSLQAELSGVGLELATVADGVYVTQNLFSESSSAAGDSMCELLGVLAASASIMMDTCYKLAAYLEKIINGFKAADFELTMPDFENEIHR